MELHDVLNKIRPGRRVRVEWHPEYPERILAIEADDMEVADLIIISSEYNRLKHQKFVEKYCKSPNVAVPVTENGHTQNN